MPHRPMLPAAIILYALGALLGGWGASLVWCAARMRLMRRRGRPVVPLTPPQRRLVLVAGVLAPLIGLACFVTAEWVRGGFRFPSYEDPAFYWTLATVLCLMLAIGAMVAGWRFDPARGRRRCGRCWYDMSGAPSLTCPECGRKARNEQDLSRTRRSRMLIALGVLLIVASYAVHMTPRVREDGWLAAVPTTVLIAGFPWWPDDFLEGNDGCLDWRDDKWKWQSDLLRWRCRRIIERSTDRELVLRAAGFYGRDVDNRPFFSRQLQRSLFTDLCSEDAKLAGEAEDLIFGHASIYIPEVLDEPLAVELVPIVEHALNAAPEERAARGAHAASFLGMHADPLLPDLLRNIATTAASEAPAGAAASKRDVRSFAAQLSVVALGSKSDAAWSAFISLLDHPNEGVQAVSCRLAEYFPERAPELLVKLDSLIDSQSDRVAGLAANAMLGLEKDPCSRVARITERAEGHNDFAAIVIQRLASTCPDDSVRSIMHRLLNSTDRSHQLRAIDAIRSFNADVTDFLPVLKALSQSVTGDADVAEEARSALRELESRTPDSVGPP